MHALVVGVAWGIVGLNVGWRALPGGGVEYIIQIAPHELDVFKLDKIIEGEIPPQVKDIRSYKIQVGTQLLPQETPKAPTAPPAQPAVPLPAKAPPAKQQQPSTTYNPFAALTSSLSERYPFAQGSSSQPSSAPQRSSAESARRDGEKLFGGGRTPTVDHKADDKKVETKKTDDETAKTLHPGAKEPDKPWAPFTVTLGTLVVSLGCNVYLGWITWETRKRFRALLRRREKAEHQRRDETDEPGNADE
jgi:hypothetical protein